MTSPGRDWRTLIVLGTLLEVVAIWVAKRMNLGDGSLSFLIGYLAMSAVYVVAVYYVLRHSQSRRGLLAFVFMVAVALRATFLFTPPVLSDDIYRYIWDGRIQREGLNPYLYAPEAPQLEYLRDPIYQRVNNKELPTIYPPVMQWIFAASTALSESVLGMKTTFVLIDLALIGALLRLLTAAGLNPMRSLIYAWSPLVVVEIAGSGHNDVLMMALLMTAHGAILLKKDTLSIFLVSLAGFAKLTAFALVPFFARWVRPLAWLAVPLTGLLLVFPYREVGKESFGGLLAYGLRWRANDSLFHLLYEATGSLAVSKLIAAGLFTGLVAWLLYRRARPLRACYISIGAILLLSPTVHPWYLMWLVPYLCFYPSPAWLVLTATIVLSYHAPFLTPPGEPWVELPLFKVLEYVPFFLLAMWSTVSQSRARGSRRDIVGAF
jgi:hypothetical protein